MAIVVPKQETHPPGRIPRGFGQTLQSFRQVHFSLPVQAKVRRQELMLFTSQLSLMLDTGIPINSSIQAIASQIKNPYFKKLLSEVVTQIEEGKSLSEALGKYPNVFSRIYISMIRAGEASGYLKEMLDRLVTFQNKREQVLATLKSAMAYPLFLVILSIGVIIFILTYVFPQFGDLFEEIRDQLPVSTKFLLFASDFLRNYWPGILITLAACGWMVWRLLTAPRGRVILDRLFLSIPGLKILLLKYYISQMMRTLGALIGGGVLLMEALHLAKGVVTSSIFGRFMDTLMESVEGGKGLAQPVIQTPFLPELVKQLVRTGEETGNLPKVMDRIADYYDEELERGLKTFSAILEPVLLLMMGTVVGLVVISLILPIFKLTRSIH